MMVFSRITPHLRESGDIRVMGEVSGQLVPRKELGIVRREKGLQL